MTSKAKRVYTLIQDKAGSNELMQGIPGFLGFPLHPDRRRRRDLHPLRPHAQRNP